MRKIVLIVMVVALVCGCAKAKYQNWCAPNETMVIEVQEDNYVVKCYKESEELDQRK